MVREALAHHRPAVKQRVSAYALVRRDDALLLTRNSVRGPRPGAWTLPGGGVGHGETPAAAVAREVTEETGLAATVGRCSACTTSTSPAPLRTVARRTSTECTSSSPPRSRPATPQVRETDGTTDAVAWVSLEDVHAGAVPVSASSPPRWTCEPVVRLADMTESVFTYGAPGLKFGEGASDEIGYDLSQYDVRRVLVITDPGVAATGHPQRVADQMGQFGIEAAVYDGAHVEPTDASIEEAIAHARDTGPWDAFVAVGGGSAIDTAKAVNLLDHQRR